MTLYDCLHLLSSNITNDSGEEAKRIINAACADSVENANMIPILRSQLETWATNDTLSCIAISISLIDDAMKKGFTIARAEIEFTKDEKYDGSWIATLFQNNNGMPFNVDELAAVSVSDDDKFSRKTYECIRYIEHFCNQTTIDDTDLVCISIMIFSFLSLCRGRLYYQEFIVIVEPLIGKLHQVSRGQDARNMTEQISQIMISDGQISEAFHVLASSYAFNQNPAHALMYQYLAIQLYNERAIHQKLVSRVIRNILLSIRNANMFELYCSRYLQYKKLSVLDEGEEVTLDLAMCYCLFYSSINEANRLAIEMIQKHREYILTHDTFCIKPWLILAYQLENRGCSILSESCGEITLFEGVVGKVIVNEIKAQITITPLSGKYLVDGIESIWKTFDVDDMAFDIKNRVHLAELVLDSPPSELTFEMIILSSIYLLPPLTERQYTEFVKIEAREHLSRGPEILNEYTERIKSIPFSSDVAVKLVVSSKKSTIVLQVSRDDVTNISTYACDPMLRDFIEHNKSLFVVEGNSFKEIFEDAESSQSIENAKLLKEKTDCAPVISSHIGERILIFRSHNDCSFPHNLYPNQNGKYLSEQNPVSLGTSRLIWGDNCDTLKDDWSIWSPRESGDMVINLTAEKIERVFAEKQKPLKTNWESVPKNIPQTDIRIILTHGEFDIDRIKEVYSDTPSSRIDIRNIIKGSKLAILLVCNSGKQSRSQFSYKMDSLVDVIFEQGCESIIAPYWPLHVEVAVEYLNIFLSKWGNGSNALNVHHDALGGIRSKNSNPSTWANMHYFGNPSICAQISESSASSLTCVQF